MSKSQFQEEFEVLQAIYIDDLVLVESAECSASLKITLHPSTADDEGKKYVCLTLNFCIGQLYPERIPEMSITNPRGISDAHLASIEENLKGLASNRIGESMLFELIEYAKESLTDNNHPSCECPICLEFFKESDEFFRTDCYHYFHLACIKGYLLWSEKFICPVCRADFQINEKLLESVDTHMESTATVEFVPDQKFLMWKEKCHQLYEQQRKKGGIIDLEYEKNKYLISLEDQVVIPPKEEIVIQHVPNEGYSQSVLPGSDMEKCYPKIVSRSNAKENIPNRGDKDTCKESYRKQSRNQNTNNVTEKHYRTQQNKVKSEHNQHKFYQGKTSETNTTKKAQRGDKVGTGEAVTRRKALDHSTRNNRDYVGTDRKDTRKKTVDQSTRSTREEKETEERHAREKADHFTRRKREGKGKNSNHNVRETSHRACTVQSMKAESSLSVLKSEPFEKKKNEFEQSALKELQEHRPTKNVKKKVEYVKHTENKDRSIKTKHNATKEGLNLTQTHYEAKSTRPPPGFEKVAHEKSTIERERMVNPPPGF